MRGREVQRWPYVPENDIFRTMRNTQYSGTPRLEMVCRELRLRLPISWAVELKAKRARDRDRAVDAFLEIRAPDGSKSVLAVKARRSVEPRDVPHTLEQLGRLKDHPPFVIAPFLAPRTRERLVAGGAGYADATGNFRLALDRPAVLLETVGATSSPWRQEHPLRSLKGPAAGRVVRALCDFKPPFGVREFAQRASTSPASTSRVINLLTRDALLTRQARGPIERVDWSGLLGRWADDYSLIDSNRTATFLEPRGLQPLLDKLANSSLSYAVTGSTAAAAVAPVAPVKLLVVYVQSASASANELALRPAEAGSNVILAEPFDSVVFERTWEAKGVTLAALSQVAIDLLTSPGRGPAEAKELITWMQDNEDAWRS